MDNSWKVPKKPDNSPIDPPVTDPQTILPSNTVRKRWIFWTILGVLFFILYTGGTYYVLFMREEKPVRKIPVTPSLAPRASATPLPTPTAIPTLPPTTEIPASWKTYTNQTYGISFQYPENMVINFNKTEPGIDPYLIVVAYPESTLSAQLTLSVQDPNYLGQSDLESRAIVNMSLQNYAAKKRDLNLDYIDQTIPTRRIGTLEMMTLSDKSAYMFTVFGSYADDRTYIKLSQEYTYVFSENNERKIIISYPTGDTILKQILDTVTFE